MSEDKKLAAWRITIDGAMILSLLTLVWHIAGWTKEIDTSIDNVVKRLIVVEKELPDPNAMPITSEADRRITALEATTQAQNAELIRWMNRIDAKLEKVQQTQ